MDQLSRALVATNMLAVLVQHPVEAQYHNNHNNNNYGYNSNPTPWNPQQRNRQCHQRGSPIATDVGFVRMCAECTYTSYFGHEYEPSSVQERRCEPNNGSCGKGSCRTVYRSQIVRRKSTTNTGVQQQQHQQQHHHQQHQQQHHHQQQTTMVNVGVGCECRVRESQWEEPVSQQWTPWARHG